jgi:uncharacterized membrane protein YsdA (DUF1294 family)
MKQQKTRKPAAPEPHKYRSYFLFASILAAVTLSQLWTIPRELIALYVGASVLLFAMYGADKLAAMWNLRRIPEATLHFIALCGGWPGGMLAQQLLAHKSSKMTFRQTARTMIALNLVIVTAIWLLTEFFSKNSP